MKFDPQRAFTFPVLRANNNDYNEGSFNMKLEINDVKKNEDNVSIKVSFDLDVQEIQELFPQNLVEYVVVFVSEKSFHRKSYSFSESKDNTFKIKKEFCRDKISFESYIVAKEKIENFKCKTINSEFGKDYFCFEQGMILAQCEEIVVDCINDKFKELTNLFKMNLDDNLKEGEWKYSIDDHYPTISVSKKQYEIIDKNKKYKGIFANSFLVNIVTQMLNDMYADDYEEDTLTWQKLIREKIDYLPGNQEIMSYQEKLKICQKILNNPLNHLNTDLKKIENQGE